MLSEWGFQETRLWLQSPKFETFPHVMSLEAASFWAEQYI